jgi:acetyl/propionyl-CoA carboxylase alpha subunit
MFAERFVEDPRHVEVALPYAHCRIMLGDASMHAKL